MMVFMVLIGMEMVVSRGNAPRSSGYQPGALLLSYKTENGEALRIIGTPLVG